MTPTAQRSVRTLRRLECTRRACLRGSPTASVLLVALTSLAACTTGTERPPESEGPAAATRSCSVTERGRQYLELEPGIQLFVEPRVVDVFEGGFMVAGAPTYTWTVDRGLRASLVSANDIFGAIVRDPGIEPIPLPPGVGPVGWVRGGPGPLGAWVFVFEELAAVDPQAAVTRVLYARYDGSGWGAVEELPEPVEGHVLLSAGSEPVTVGSDVIWAAPVERDGPGRGIALFRRRAGHWSVEMRVRPLSPNAVALTGAADGGVYLGAAGLDSSSDWRPRLELLLLRSGSEPLPVADTLRPPGQPTSLELLEVDDALHAAWLEVDGPEGRLARAGVPASGPRTGSLLDVDAVRLLAVGTQGADALWATQAPDPVLSSDRIRIHLMASATGQVVRVADIRSPYLGPFGLSLSPQGEIVVVGPEARLESTTPFVRSLVLRLSLSCDPVTAADHLPGQ